MSRAGLGTKNDEGNRSLRICEIAMFPLRASNLMIGYKLPCDCYIGQRSLIIALIGRAREWTSEYSVDVIM